MRDCVNVANDRECGGLPPLWAAQNESMAVTDREASLASEKAPASRPTPQGAAARPLVKDTRTQEPHAAA